MPTLIRPSVLLSLSLCLTAPAALSAPGVTAQVPPARAAAAPSPAQPAVLDGRLTPGTAEFTLTARPAALRVDAGRRAAVQVLLGRPADPVGTVTLTAEGDRVGSGVDRIGVSFGGAGGTTLTLNVGAEVPVGPHAITVLGRNGDQEHVTTLTVTVERWLLVDDDRSGNNWPANRGTAPDSAGDRWTRAALTAAGRTFEERVVPYSGSGQDRDEPSGPGAADLARYSGVIWYTGNTTVRPITDADQQNLTAFLNSGQRTVILFSPGFVRDASVNGAALAAPRPATLPLVSGLLGLDRVAFPGAATYALTGAPGTPAASLHLNVTGSVRGSLQPGAGATPLLRDGPNVVVSARARVGTKGTSKAVLAALSTSHLTPQDGAALLGSLMRF